MALANQYGINLGNILRTGAAIKTAKINQEHNQMVLDKEKAGVKNNAFLLKNSPYNNMMDNGDNITSTPSVFNQKTSPLDTRNWTKDQIKQNALNPKAYYTAVSQKIKLNATQNQYKANIAYIKSINPNMPDAQVKSLAWQKTKDLANMFNQIGKNKNLNYKMAKTIADNIGRQAYIVAHSADNIADPTQKAQVLQNNYTQWRNSLLEQASTPEDKQKILSDMPEQYNPNFIAFEIASGANSFKALTELDKINKKFNNDKKLANIKTKNAENLADYKDTNKVNDPTLLDKYIEKVKWLKANEPNSPYIKVYEQAIKTKSQGKVSPLDALIAQQLNGGKDNDTNTSNGGGITNLLNKWGLNE